MNKYQPHGYIILRVEESDAPAVIELFKLNYPRGYPDLYDEQRIRYDIYSGNVIWLKAVAIEEQEKVLAAGAITLDYGDYNDQLGLIGKLVTRPGQASSGIVHTLGSDIVSALVSEAEDNVECVIGFARTFHRVSQKYVEDAGLKAVGLLPHYKIIDERRENFVLYTKLCGQGSQLRSEKLPQVIPEIAPLAQHALSAMELPTALGIVNDCPSYHDEFNGNLQLVDRHSLTQLRQIDRGRLSDPIMFDNVSLDYGMPVLARKEIQYLMAVDNQQLLGAIGYKVDQVNQTFKITELVFNRTEVVNYLCAKALDKAKQEEAKVIEVDLSAYDALIQQTFLNYGFHPVAYIPAMVVHNTYRLDIIKMIRLEVLYDSRKTKLTEKAREVVSLVEGRLNSAQIINLGETPQNIEQL
jgi:hypothetical protein